MEVWADAKSFEILVEGEGKNLKGFITERSRGLVSWVRFGEEGLKSLLKGVEECCKDVNLANRTFKWKENGRLFRLFLQRE